MKNNSLDFSLFEKEINDFWAKQKVFYQSNTKNKFSILLPPPNVTGQLHLGHAWDGTLQDFFLRYKRLTGYNSVWIPGTDHAGIATQTKFENLLKSQGVDKNSLPKKEFLNQLGAWASKQKAYIHEQWQKLGFGLDYSKELYTIDDSVRKLVKNTFSQLVKDKLVYIGERVVNWDTTLQTAISDIEVVYKQENSKLFFFKYSLPDGSFLSVATARPETMFADVALFVNPDDKRYKKVIGQYATNPINGQKIKVYADRYVDMGFGTGVMKCTPAHDLADYDLGLKYKLPCNIDVVDNYGRLNSLANTLIGNFAGQDRLVARTAIVAALEKLGALIKTEDITHNVGYSERSGAVIEQILSNQIFIRMEPLSTKALKMIKEQKPTFFPERYYADLKKWLKKIKDWCVSRQLVWGHEIPIWTTNKKISLKDEPGYKKCLDVFDTWFSSGLWPIATTEKYPHLFPIDLLVTGYDILFFWVARMYLLCGYMNKKIPLLNVYIHGLIRDENHKKMSKSLGNGVDPLDLIKEYGVDGLRLFLLANSTQGEDLSLNREKLAHGWAIVNKLWNVANFINNLPNKHHKTMSKQCHPLISWLLSEFNKTTTVVKQHLDKYNINVAYKYLETFFWDTFCNTFIEIAKKYIGDLDDFIVAIDTVFQGILTMFHAFIPFTTEKLYQERYGKYQSSILNRQWPEVINFTGNQKITNSAIEIINHVRTHRIKNSIKSSDLVEISLKQFDCHSPFVQDLFRRFNITVVQGIAEKNFVALSSGAIIAIKQKSLTKEQIKLEEERLMKEIARAKGILGNKQFLNKAPKEKVAEEKTKLDNYIKQLEALKNKN